jgi:tripeptide aminopeptidase
MTTHANPTQNHAIDEDRVLQTMLELIRIDSPTGQEQTIAHALSGRLEQLGGTLSRDDTGNLIARFPGSGTPIMLACHMDTVVPGTSIKPVVRDGVVYSDGTTILGADDNRALPSCSRFCSYCMTTPDWARPPLEFVLTVSEEQGLVGSRNLDMSQIQARYGFVLDTWGPIGSITTAAPSTTYLDITITGKRAHGGVEPEKGSAPSALPQKRSPPCQ